jgi:hypothetical protein
MRPYLIQRGEFRKIADNDIVGLDALIDYDYMGSAEFEFGSLGESLEKICKEWAAYKIVRMEDIKDMNGNILYYLAPATFMSHIDSKKTLTAEDLKEVMTNLFTKKSHYRLKEWSNCYEHIYGDTYNTKVPSTNFWWDIDYHWMACFGKDIKRLILAIQKVCVKKTLPFENGPSVTDEIFQEPIFTLDLDKNKLTVTSLTGSITIVHLNNILAVSESPEQLMISVSTKSGDVRNLSIQVPASSKREYVLKVLKNQVDTNKWRKAKEQKNAKAS